MSMDVAHQRRMMNDDQGHHLPFGCHVAVGNMAPVFHIKHGWLFPSMSNCLHLWAVNFFHKQSFLLVGSCFQLQVVDFMCRPLFAFVGSCLGSWVVFESPVRSSFLMPKGFNRNRNQSPFSQKSKDRTGLQKDCRPQFFAVFRPVSVFIGFNRFMTGL